MTHKGALNLKTFFSVNLLLLVLLLGIVVGIAFIGSPMLTPSRVFGAGADPLSADLFFHARLPRVLLGALVGGGLAASGVVFQSLLRNPLADPYILGVSGGAALGCVVGLVAGLSFHWMTLSSFLFGVGSLFLIYAVAREKGRLPVHTLLLTGIIFNAFAFALILLIHSLTQMQQMHQIFHLLLGSLEATDLGTVFWVALFEGIGLVVLFVASGLLNPVSLGEEQASYLGIDAERARRLLFFAASAIVGATVAVAGLIGFVGLFVPHMMRMIVGVDHRLLLPASVLGGGIFLVLCDFATRLLATATPVATQIPIGVVTALLGGPFFAYLLKRSR